MIEGRFSADVCISDSHRGERIDRLLTKLVDGLSRTEIKNWIVSGLVTVDGLVTKPSYRVKGGEKVSIRGTRKEPMSWDSESGIEFNVIYEDEHVLVVDKPAGVVVHPGAGNPKGTLINGLISYRPEIKQLPRAGIVHRLDKDTSGLLIVATTKESYENLVASIASREIRREYMCVMEGIMEVPYNVDQPIARHPINRTKQAIRTDGRPAISDFYPQEIFRAHTLARVKLSTGRTHQIRVHAQSIGFPLVADSTYGARGVFPRTPSPELVSCIREFSRQALHATYLEFAHPVSGESVSLRSMLPSDLHELIAALRNDREFFV